MSSATALQLQYAPANSIQRKVVVNNRVVYLHIIVYKHGRQIAQYRENSWDADAVFSFSPNTMELKQLKN